MDPGIIAATDGGEWRQQPLNLPLPVLGGDVLNITGNTLQLIRHGNVVATRTLGAETTFATQPIADSQTLTHVIHFRRTPVPSVSATITNTTINQASGVVRVNFSSGDQREFADFAALQAVADAIDTDPAKAQDLAILALVRRSPDGSNLDVCNGMGVTIDGAANQPVAYSGLPQI